MAGAETKSFTMTKLQMQHALVKGYLSERIILREVGPTVKPRAVILKISAEEGDPGFIIEVKTDADVPKGLSSEEAQEYKAEIEETLNKVNQQVHFQGLALRTFQTTANLKGISLAKLVEDVQQRMPSN